MFGRFKENEDEPGWKEKLAEWRDSPPIILERPEWLGESPASLALLFGGIALLLVSFVYFIVPAEALPRGDPGPVDRAEHDGAEVDNLVVDHDDHHDATGGDAARLKAWSQDSEAKKDERRRWIAAVQEFRTAEAEAEAIASQPPKPPYRRWAYGFLAASLAAGMLVAAWAVSDARSRRHWSS